MITTIFPILGSREDQKPVPSHTFPRTHHTSCSSASQHLSCDLASNRQYGPSNLVSRTTFSAMSSCALENVRATLAAIALLSATTVAVFNAVIAHPLSFRSVSKLCSASLNFCANLSIVTSAVTICNVFMSSTHATQVASTTPASSSTSSHVVVGSCCAMCDCQVAAIGFTKSWKPGCQLPFAVPCWHRA